ncbi:plasma membrane proteolipid Pmp3 [Aspergillus brasiliensis]|nr:plasma membrane proteolipid Pmp3 [Aspergillus brasiliensis]
MPGKVGCCEIIIAFFLPFVGVFMRTGCSCDLLINICLCILGWVPGVIHAYQQINTPQLTWTSVPDVLVGSVKLATRAFFYITGALGVSTGTLMIRNDYP